MPRPVLRKEGRIGGIRRIPEIEHFGLDNIMKHRDVASSQRFLLRVRHARVQPGIVHPRANLERCRTIEQHIGAGRERLDDHCVSWIHRLETGARNREIQFSTLCLPGWNVAEIPCRNKKASLRYLLRISRTPAVPCRLILVDGHNVGRSIPVRMDNRLRDIGCIRYGKFDCHPHRLHFARVRRRRRQCFTMTVCSHQPSARYNGIVADGRLNGEAQYRRAGTSKISHPAHITENRTMSGRAPRRVVVELVRSKFIHPLCVVKPLPVRGGNVH